jgi:Ca-activated chloride channel family protein
MLFAGAVLALACAATGTQPAAGPEPRPSGVLVTDAVADAPVVEAPGEPQLGSGTSEDGLVIHTEPGELPRLEIANDSKELLPLEHTHVKARLTGYVAEVEVSQTYRNPSKRPIEAVYVFPLPENSAVNALRMVIGTRVVEGQIKEREAARRTYAAARAQGFTAALLEQERPNVFTQSVANIAPGEKIDVVVRYVQDLSYDAGEYEFVFPMVVGPRYMPGRALEGPSSGTGTHPDTNRVPDAARISPPYVGKGERNGHDISLELVADTTLAVADFEVPTHEVVARKPADGTLRLTLAEKDSLPNRDFVLRYRAAAPEPKASLFLAPSGGKQGFFSLVVEPPDLDIDQTVGRREVVFVVDVSGSMSGVPLAMCKRAMREALGMLRPVDTFNVITFAGSTGQAFPAPRAANAANLKRAFEVVDRMEAGGGTEMLDAVATALSPRVERGRHRYVFFMTDGYVGNESQIIASASRFVAEVERGGQRARVFSFGVGSSVNRHLIDGLARAGNGTAVVATTREDPARAVNTFFRTIDRPILEDLRLELGNLKSENLFPVGPRDLFASHPVILHGTYSGEPTGNLTVVATNAGRDVRLPVKLRNLGALEGKAPSVLGMLWARSKVTALDEVLSERGSQAVRQEIIELGERFHLVTRFTSLVAVDRSRRVSDGRPEQVVVPVEGPEGVDLDRAGGRPRKTRIQLSETSIAKDKPKSAAAAPAAPPPEPGPREEPERSRTAQEESTHQGYSANFDEAPEAPPPSAGETEEEAALEGEKTDDEVQISEPMASAARPEQKRGCGCRVVGNESSPLSLFLAAGAVLLFVLRRRGRT